MTLTLNSAAIVNPADYYTLDLVMESIAKTSILFTDTFMVIIFARTLKFFINLRTKP